MPPQELAGMLALAACTENELAALERALAASPVVIDRASFLRGIPQVAGLDAAVQDGIVGALLFLHGFLVMDGVDEKDFLDALGASLVARRVNEESVGRLTEALPRFLDIESLRLRAKAVDLQTDHAHPLQVARVFTDTRPVFGSSPDDISGVIVFHTLKLRYFNDDGVRELYLALDTGMSIA